MNWLQLERDNQPDGCNALRLFTTTMKVTEDVEGITEKMQYLNRGLINTIYVVPRSKRDTVVDDRKI